MIIYVYIISLQQFQEMNTSTLRIFYRCKCLMFMNNSNNILRSCVIESCCGIEKTAPNQISSNFTRVSDTVLLKCMPLLVPPRKERGV